MKALKIALIGVLGFGLIATLFPATNAFAGDDKDRYECQDFGEDIDTSLDAELETRGLRKKLSISFEAGADTEFAAKDPVTGLPSAKVPVTVTNISDGTVTMTTIGHISLEFVVGGGVDGDLNFDTNTEEDDRDFSEIKTPIDEGSVISAGELKCMLAAE